MADLRCGIGQNAETVHARRVRENAAEAVETQHAKAVIARSQRDTWKQNALDWQAYARKLEAQPKEVVYVGGGGGDYSAGYSSDIQEQLDSWQYDAERDQLQYDAEQALADSQWEATKAKRALKRARRREQSHEAEYGHGY